MAHLDVGGEEGLERKTQSPEEGGGGIEEGD